MSVPFEEGMKPVVLRDEEDEIATFESPEAIENVAMQHLLACAVWHAFNFTNGELVVI